MIIEKNLRSSQGEFLSTQGEFPFAVQTYMVHRPHLVDPLLHSYEVHASSINIINNLALEAFISSGFSIAGKMSTLNNYTIIEETSTHRRYTTS
jgi:hypothetical protein